MKIANLPFVTFDWTRIPAEEAPGEAGTSLIRSFEAGEFRCRLVTYGPGYIHDHWCSKGHIFFTIGGEVIIEFQSGRAVPLSAGQGFCVDDHSDPHRIRTAIEASAYIVD